MCKYCLQHIRKHNSLLITVTLIAFCKEKRGNVKKRLTKMEKRAKKAQKYTKVHERTQKYVKEPKETNPRK